MGLLKIRLLGAFEAWHDDLYLTSFARRKALALLAYLCLEQTSMPHQRDKLAALLWSDVPQEEARRSLRQCLYQLRRSLNDHDDEAHILVTSQTVALDSKNLTSDVSQMRQALLNKTRLEPESCRGEILAGFNVPDGPLFEEWLTLQREQLRRELTQSLTRQQREAEQAEDWATCIEVLRQLLELDPLAEETHLALMRAYFAAGERKAALDQYLECERMLKVEFDQLPDKTTTNLYQQIKAAAQPELNLPDLAKSKKNSQRYGPPASYLALQASDFVGRTAEIAQLYDLLTQPTVRLITLTGPGGTGKTRLALQVATALFENEAFENGVQFVELDTLQNAALLLNAIYGSFGLKESGAEKIDQLLKNQLAPLNLLLVLDNFEQILDGAKFIIDLLTAAPNLKILITSRIALRIYGEHQFAVPPLKVPEALPDSDLDFAALSQNEAIELFVRRSRAVRPDFTLKPENCRALAEICCLLDGLPLAIELAASQSRLYTPPALLERLQATAIGLATRNAQNIPLRQQTLRATLEWSYNLLGVNEQNLFAQLAVFAGSFTLEAVATICVTSGESVELLLDELLNSSILRYEETPQGELRFNMPVSMREYAREKLLSTATETERAALYESHARYYFKLSEQGINSMGTPAEKDWLPKITQNYDNILAALATTLEQEASYLDLLNIGLQLAEVFWPYWLRRGRYSEGRRWLELALKRADARLEQINELLYARLLHGLGSVLTTQSEFLLAIKYFEISLTIRRMLDDKAGIASILNNLGIIYKDQNDYLKARDCLEESLAIRRELGNLATVAISLNNLSLVYRRMNDHEAALKALEESLELRWQLGDRFGAALVLGNLGIIYRYKKDFVKAREYQLESMSLAKDINNQQHLSICLGNLGLVAKDEGKLDEAIDYFQQTLQIQQKLGIMVDIANSYRNLADIALLKEDLPTARNYYEQELKLRQEYNNRPEAIECLNRLLEIARKLEQPSQAAWLEKTLATVTATN